jgi:threonine/homoserine/homoserine lactone efflux protein
VLFGMVIATLCVWMRALRVIVATVGLAGGAYLVYRWWNNRAGNDANGRTGPGQT